MSLFQQADDKKAVVKEKGKGYLESNLFAVCNFDLNSLPLKLNFPMVCKREHPMELLDSLFDLKEIIKKPFVLSDLRGGYLSGPTLNIYYIFKLVFYHPIT